MKQLFVICEGPTEQGFCNEVMYDHLLIRNVIVHTMKVGRKHRSGIPTHYQVLHDDIESKMREHQNRPDVYFTTMIDLYKLPMDFPGKATNTRIPENPTPYVEALESEFAKTINDRRFIPYIQLHEYEALLFVDPDAFEIAFDDIGHAIQSLKKIADSFATIEHINDGEPTAPSKRIIDLIPEYEGAKTTAGPDIAEYIGLTQLRMAAPHFNAWIARLEQL